MSSRKVLHTDSVPRHYMAVAQEVHHGHFHLGPIGGTKPTPPTDVEVEAKVAEAENASVSWKRHVTSKGTAWDADSPEIIYTFISVTKVLQGFQLYYGMFVVLLFLLGCFMRVAGIQRGKMSSCLFSFVSNLVNFFDSTEFIYIYTSKIHHILPYHHIIPFHMMTFRKKNMFLMFLLSSKVSLTLLGVLALTWQSMVNRTGDLEASKKSHTATPGWHRFLEVWETLGCKPPK